jgi:cysteine-rich repeat protein
MKAGAAWAVLLLVSSGPAFATDAADLCAAAADPCVVATPVPVTNRSVIDVGTRELRIAAGGALDVGSGTMTIRAGRLTVDGNGAVKAAGSTVNSGGTILVEAGAVVVAGSIEANGTPGGTITVTATGDVSVTGATGLSARSLSREEVGGTITVRAANTTLAGPVSVLGGPDSVGGDANLTSTGSVVITSTIDAAGGDGGSIDIEAGATPGAGNIVIGDLATLRVDATFEGGFGGTLDVFARGDGVDLGHVAVDGTLSALGRGGGAVGGGAGGCITILADGDVLNLGAGTSLSTAGGGPDGEGGEIEITANRGVVELHGTLDSGSPGAESSGGSVSIDAQGEVAVFGSIDAEAGSGGGGEVAIRSGAANVEVAPSATIEVDGGFGGAGGNICIDNGTVGPEQTAIVIQGILSASGRSDAGPGGTIELAGGDAVRLATGAALRAGGGSTGGPGGTIIVDVADGPALIDGPLDAAGGRPSGDGGIITIDASQRIVVTAVADARGFGPGGEIGLASTGAVDVRADLLAGSTTADGGGIEIRSEGAVTIAASLIADGVTLPGALIDVEGCSITLCERDSSECPSGGTGILSSLGPEGRNRTTGRDRTTILGTMRADAVTGHNELRYGGAADQRPVLLGTIDPPAVLISSPDVRRCPACGNLQIDPPETCDDGNQFDGDGCSHVCQVEAPIPGDANGDFDLSPEDRGFGVAEIFDGDGDTIGTVSDGTFPGAPGADANDDDLVTAADLVAITRLLAP